MEVLEMEKTLPKKTRKVDLDWLLDTEAGQGLLEKGIEKGRKAGIEEGIEKGMRTILFQQITSENPRWTESQIQAEISRRLAEFTLVAENPNE
jgi:hypothetical protein